MILTPLVRSAILVPPIRPGTNAQHKTESPRSGWIGGTIAQPRSNFLARAGFPFMKITQRVPEVAEFPNASKPWIQYVQRPANPVRPQWRKFTHLLTPLGRFFFRVQATSLFRCWNYIGNLNKTGYGMFWDQTLYLAHRYAWTHVIGPIPKGQQVLHECDNPACVNPFHHRLGLPVNNMNDCVIRNRITRGVKRKTSKLTDDSVRELRDFYRANLGTFRLPKYFLLQVSERFGVNITTAHRAATGLTWKHIENPVVIPGYRYK